MTSPYRTPGEPIKEPAAPAKKEPWSVISLWAAASVMGAILVDYIAWRCGAGLGAMPIAPMLTLTVWTVAMAVIRGDDYKYVERSFLNDLIEEKNKLKAEVNDLRFRYERQGKAR